MVNTCYERFFLLLILKNDKNDIVCVEITCCVGAIRLVSGCTSHNEETMHFRFSGITSELESCRVRNLR